MKRLKLTCVALLVSLLSGMISTPAQGDPSTLFNRFDHQAHIFISYQAAITAAKILQKFDTPRLRSAFLGTTLSLTASLAKETLIDPTFDLTDLSAGAIGAALGFITILIWPGSPGKPSWLTLDAEGGLAGFYPFAGSANPPPISWMIHTQNTLWIHRALGVHLFSGGIGLTPQAESPQKLLFGAGLRFSLYPFLWKNEKSDSRFSVWGGVDYGFLLFSVNNNTTYPASGYAPYYSMGLKWKPKKTVLFLASEALLVPYFGTLLVAPAFQLGLEL